MSFSNPVIPAAGGVTDHGALTGLGDDDHAQYLLTNGTRALTGNQSAGGNKITNLGLPTTDGDAANKQHVREYVEQRVDGLDYQDGVVDKDLTAPPGAPVLGDRYIIAAVATGAWAGHDKQIAEWDGAAWMFLSPQKDWTVLVRDENVEYVYNDVWPAGSWISRPSTTPHNNLSGLQGGGAAERFHLTAAERTGLVTGVSASGLHTHAPADITPQGHTSTLDADLLDGQHASEFQPAFSVGDNLSLISDVLDAKNEQVITLESIIPSVFDHQRYNTPVGHYFFDAAGESTLEVDMGAGYVPAVFNTDYVHLPRGFTRPGPPSSVLDAVIGFRWINGQVQAGWTFKFTWKERKILFAPASVMAVSFNAGVFDNSYKWRINEANFPQITNGIRVPLLPGYQVEVWRFCIRRGGNTPNRQGGDGARYVPYYRGATDDPLVDFQTLFTTGKHHKYRLKVCYYNPVTGSRSGLCAEQIYWMNFTKNPDILGSSGQDRSRQGSVWIH